MQPWRVAGFPTRIWCWIPPQAWGLIWVTTAQAWGLLWVTTNFLGSLLNETVWNAYTLTQHLDLLFLTNLIGQFFPSLSASVVLCCWHLSVLRRFLVFLDFFPVFSCSGFDPNLDLDKASLSSRHLKDMDVSPMVKVWSGSGILDM